MDESIVLRNDLELRGALAAAPQFSHMSRGERFFVFPVETRRLSGAADRINVIARQSLLESAVLPDESGGIYVRGELRSFNNKSGTGSKLVITLHAKSIKPGEGPNENRLTLAGVLCKPPVFRRTPLGREICDLMLAVNRKYGRADYLPCIAWGAIAQQTARLPVGSRLTVEGRVQSRGYTKTVDGVGQERTAYEVSIMRPAEPEEFLL